MTTRIELFGHLRVTRSGRALALPSDFPRMVFAFLARNRGLTFARGELATRLWPDLDQKRGRAALGTALWRMRQVPQIADVIGLPSRDTLCVPARRDVWVDVDAFERRAARARVLDHACPEALRRARQAATLWRAEPFLDVSGEWVGTERARLGTLLAEVLETWMEAAAAAGRDSEALHAASRLIDAEPFEERPRALRCAILTRRGSMARARQEHRIFAAFLDAELGVPPSFAPDGTPAQEDAEA